MGGSFFVSEREAHRGNIRYKIDCVICMGH